MGFLDKKFFKNIFNWIFIIFGIMAFKASRGIFLPLLFLDILGIYSLLWGKDKENIRINLYSLFSLYLPYWFLAGSLFLLYIIASSFWAFGPMISLKAASRVVFFICLNFFAFAYIETQKMQNFLQAKKALRFGFAFLGGVLLLNIGGFFLKNYMNISWQNVSWPFCNLQHLTKEGIFLGFFFWIFALYFLKELTQKKFWALGIGITLICGILPQRAAFLGMVCGLLSYTFVYYWPKGISLINSSFLGLGFVFPLLGKYLFVPTITNTIFLKLPSSWQHRFYIWNFVSNRIMEKPLLGWGFDSSRHFPNVKGYLHFFTSTGQISYTDTHTSLIPLHPHNGFLQLWLEEGFLGILLFLSMVGFGVRWFLKTLSSVQEKALFMGGLGMLFVPFCVSFGIWQTWWLSMWVWYLIFWAFYKKTNKINEKKLSY